MFAHNVCVCLLHAMQQTYVHVEDGCPVGGMPVGRTLMFRHLNALDDVLLLRLDVLWRSSSVVVFSRRGLCIWWLVVRHAVELSFCGFPRAVRQQLDGLCS